MPQVEIKDGLGSPIQLNEHNGKYFPPFPVLRDNLHLHNLPDMPCRDDDVVILTYPKAGTHWSWEIVNMLYTGDGQISNRDKGDTMLEAVNIETMTALPSVRLLNTHLTPEFYPIELMHRKCKIIFVQRNPKDIYTSYYHHTRKLKMYGYDGEWNGYFELLINGKHDYGSWFEFTKLWDDIFIQHPDIPVLRLYFEDMKLDLPSAIDKMAGFLHLPCSATYRDKVAEKCGFEAMKHAMKIPQEILNRLTKDGVNPIFRKGITGDWKNLFTVAQNEKFDMEYNRQMCGFKGFKFERYK